MKKIKISLAIIVIASIAIFSIRSLVIMNKPKVIVLPKNLFTERIEKEIDSLEKLPESKFCKDAYDNVLFLIDDYYKPHPPQYPYGRLGDTQLENNHWKENLTKNLFSVYAGKFLSQALYVFSHSNWEFDDLRFIRQEYQTLKKSNLLERDSPVDIKFAEFQAIFNKYDEIAGFISTCNGFSYSSSSSSDHFPITEVQAKISRAVTYQNNNLENGFVNNCKRLHDGLKEIPETLFRVHIRYLDKKINDWSGFYSNYSSQSDYVNNLYKPVKSEIDALDNAIYKVANFNSEYTRLTNKWSSDNSKAYSYSYPKMQ